MEKEEHEARLLLRFIRREAIALVEVERLNGISLFKFGIVMPTKIIDQMAELKIKLREEMDHVLTLFEQKGWRIPDPGWQVPDWLIPHDSQCNPDDEPGGLR